MEYFPDEASDKSGCGDNGDYGQYDCAAAMSFHSSMDKRGRWIYRISAEKKKVYQGASCVKIVPGNFTERASQC